MATPRWAASGPAKVFQSYGQCKGEERRRELVASLGASGDAEETFQRAALTLWSIALDGKAKKFAAAEGSTLPVLSLALTNRLEQLVGAKASAFDLDVTKAQAALQAARDAGSAQQVADASLALAAAQVLVEPNLEKLAEIVELVMGALTLLEEDKAGTAVALNILANVHILMGHGKDALRAAKQGLYALRSMGGQKIFEVPLLQTMMSACWLRSDSDEALRCCEEVAGICQEAKVDPVILALADGCTALASLANDEQGPAERKVETALKSLKDADGQILLLGALQEISFAIGKPVSALKAAQDLLEKERKRGVKEGVARALLLVSASSEEDEAKAKATEAKQLFGTLRDPLGEGLALVSLAKAQLASSTASALPVAKESFEAFQGCLVGQGFASSLLTLAYLRQEDAKQAERTSREALTMFQDGKHRVGQALAEFLLRKSQELSQKPSECKIVIDDDRVAHVEIAGICTPKSLDFVLNALHQARVKEGVKAVVMLLRGSKGPVSPAGYPGTAGGLSATPQAQALASGSFLLGLRTLGLPMVVACVGKIAGPAWGLVLAADYRIAASTSTFILPIWGPPECFGDLVGHTVAMQLCYNQGPVSALTMLEYGVIHQCQRGEEETQSSAAEVARRIASTPSLACHQSTTMLSPAIEKYASIVARGGVRA
ncbi:unnamed protein product [Durusdinium trenchii]|uniref:Uncharacterized protein n=1 Tax=Durusdinium trenchii TaxID=1381693 RepID=A0ABP0H830_9DINO